MNKQKKIMFGILVGLFLLVVLIFVYNKFGNKEKDIKVIKHGVVEELYDNVSRNDRDEDQDKKYVSKLYGYTSDKDENIIMNTKEGYIKDNFVYDLDDNLLGKYEEETLNKLLDQATTKTYKFNKDKDKYNLSE